MSVPLSDGLYKAFIVMYYMLKEGDPSSRQSASSTSALVSEFLHVPEFLRGIEDFLIQENCPTLNFSCFGFI